MKRFYVYIAYDSKNVPRYVGKGSNGRWHNIVNRSNEKVTSLLMTCRKEIIMDGIDEAKAFRIERRLIARLGREDLRQGPLWNLTDGGPGAKGTIRVLTAEHRSKLRKPHRLSEAGRLVLANRARTLVGANTKGWQWITNEVGRTRIPPGAPIPLGWRKGSLPLTLAHREKLSIAARRRKLRSCVR